MAKKSGGGKAAVGKNKGPNVDSQARKTKSMDEIMGVGDLKISEVRNRVDDIEEMKTPDESLKEFIVDSAVKRAFSDWLFVISKKNNDRSEWDRNAEQSSRGNTHSPISILQWNDELNGNEINNVSSNVVELNLEKAESRLDQLKVDNPIKIDLEDIQTEIDY